jgi:hypothetical protein
MSLDLLMEVAGWIGALLILAAYGLLSAGRLDARNPAYQWLNVVGAIGFIANSGWHEAWPSAILNVIWVGIGLVALVRIFARRAKAAA